MKTRLLADEKEILEAPHYQPSVSLILPFEPKMALKAELESRLKQAVDNVERQLLGNYVAEKAMAVVNKLKALVKKIDFSTYRQSIAIFVSPLVEKLYYLDIPVEEKVIVGESFAIRDLVINKKDAHNYLVLVLSGTRARLYLGNSTRFDRLSMNTPEHIAAFQNDIPERVGNFSDPSERKDVLAEKFFRHIDAGLGIIIEAYKLPFFIMGTERCLGHFKKLTHHAHAITGFVRGNYEEAGEAEIRKAIAPHIADWKKVKQRDAVHRLEAAADANKLVSGIQDVWKEAMHRRGRLLVVEKNYRYAAQRSAADSIEPVTVFAGGNALHIKDAVDEIIEQVLENGGDVEFVEEGTLAAYQRIALVLYY